MKNLCRDCDVAEVCRRVFGKFWLAKSHNGEGCDHPMQEVADLWRKAEWRPRPRAQEERSTC